MPQTVSLRLLDRVRIASPCPVKWEQMEGDDRQRYCHQCKLNVYNFAELPESDAERLIRETEGRLCGLLYRRADGTIITKDCPVGLAAIRRRMRRIVARVAAALFFVLGGFALARADLPRSSRLSTISTMQPFASIARWLEPNSPPAPGRIAVMGDIWIAPPQGTTNGTATTCGTNGN